MVIKKKKKPKKKEEHVQVLLCPEHFQELHPPQPPELLQCHICGKALQFKCITCQQYEHDWEDEGEGTEEVRKLYEERAKNQDYPFDYTKQKSIKEWWEHKKYGRDEEGITEQEYYNLVGDLRDVSIKGIIPESEQTSRRFYTLQELKDILSKGWEGYKKEREEKAAENEKKYKENVETRKTAERTEAARKKAEAEAKRAKKQGIGVQSGLWVLIRFQPKNEQRLLNDTTNQQTIEVQNSLWTKGDIAATVNRISIDKTKSEEDWDGKYVPMIIGGAGNWMEMVLNPFTQIAPVWLVDDTIEIKGNFSIRKVGEGIPAPSTEDVVFIFTPDLAQNWLNGAVGLGFRQDPDAVFVKVKDSYHNYASIDSIMLLKRNAKVDWKIYADLIRANVGNELEVASKIIYDPVESGSQLGNMVPVLGQFEIRLSTTPHYEI